MHSLSLDRILEFLDFYFLLVNFDLQFKEFGMAFLIVELFLYFILQGGEREIHCKCNSPHMSACQDPPANFNLRPYGSQDFAVQLPNARTVYLIASVDATI